MVVAAPLALLALLLLAPSADAGWENHPRPALRPAERRPSSPARPTWRLDDDRQRRLLARTGRIA